MADAGPCETRHPTKASSAVAVLRRSVASARGRRYRTHRSASADGASPSGKAAAFDAAIPRFEPWRPSQTPSFPAFLCCAPDVGDTSVAVMRSSIDGADPNDAANGQRADVLCWLVGAGPMRLDDRARARHFPALARAGVPPILGKGFGWRQAGRDLQAWRYDPQGPAACAMQCQTGPIRTIDVHALGHGRHVGDVMETAPMAPECPEACSPGVCVLAASTPF